jgi:diguanylate cyclase (GGDEF)-like protein
MGLFASVLALLCLSLGVLVIQQHNSINILKEQVATDPLTALLNRRAFERAFMRLIKLLPDNGNKRRSSLNALTLFFIDLDHFKQINDIHGHDIGDEVLMKVAAIIRETLRDSDLVCRWGGEEIVVALPGVFAPEAEKVAEKVRKAVAGLGFSVRDLRVTASVGVTATRERIDLEELIKLADVAVYQAKAAGRNRVVSNYH